MNKGFKAFLNFTLLTTLLTIMGCSTVSTTPPVMIEPGCRWGIVAFTNNTEVPQAGQRAMSVTAGVLRAKGARTVKVFPANSNCSKLIVCPNATVPVKEVVHWARAHHLSYVMMGSVNEWDYKVGLDGEPVAAVSLQVYQVRTGQMVWSAVGSRIGTSRSGLGVIAQELITKLLCTLRIL